MRFVLYSSRAGLFCGMVDARGEATPGELLKIPWPRPNRTYQQAKSTAMPGKRCSHKATSAVCTAHCELASLPIFQTAFPPMPIRKILFVCLGNICRSPLAEAIFQQLAEQNGAVGFAVDSAGTSGWHQGERADPRSREVAQRNGVAIKTRSRVVCESDFQKFDLILAMDRENLQALAQRCPADERGKLRLIREWDPLGSGDVPDPYFGGTSGFDENFAMLQRCCEKLLADLNG